MTNTRLATLLVSPLMLLLYGCQPDAPAQKTESSPTVAASAAASQVAATAQPAPAAPAATEQAPKTAAVAVSASKERDLAQKHGCFACHTIEKKLVGPSWNDIAAKYRGQRDAETKLIAKVAKGGSGVWGAVPMPPNSPKVGEADIKVLVRFILALK
jgi:cytochrome c